jgi:hypothetical protein
VNALFRKPSIRNREMTKIQKEISPLDHDVPYLSSELPRRFVSASRHRHNTAGIPEEMATGTGSHVTRTVRRALGWESRLFDYLPGGSFQSSRPRRYGRRLRRNRAVALTLFAALWAYWVVVRFC